MCIYDQKLLWKFEQNYFERFIEVKRWTVIK